MSLVIVPFILHVHRNIVTLQWGRNMVEDVTKKITADHLPKLEAFTGYGIRYLIRTHSLKKLNLISLGTGDVVSGKTGHSLLVETSSCLPDLRILMAIFKSRDERSYALELVRIVVPALPKLRSLCITIKLTATGSWMQAEDLYRLRGTRARSLLIMTFQFIMKSAYYIRNDIYRETSKGRWKIRSFEGRDRMRKFTM
ncbi:hypothetical protein FRC17_003591 [Serendipita sp. 399]|nr:hypothetical protein FRC17_003591 [Serendipita sp. 399]